MNKFVFWFRDNQFEVTWFLIGFLCADGFASLARGDSLGALFDFGIAFLNYVLNKRR
jgi:hypothetical protein